jgi:GRIP domain
MIASINALEIKYSAEASKLQDDVKSDLTSKLAAAEERLRQMEANHDSEVHRLKEQIKLSQESGEASTREIHIAKELLESQLVTLQLEKESSERAVAEMKVELDKARAELEKAMQASASEGRVSELEQILSEKNGELSSSKMKYEEDLAAVHGQLSHLEIQKRELETKLKAANDAEAELEKRGNEMAVSIKELEIKHAAEIAALREQIQSDLNRDTDAMIQESVARESKKHADEIQQLKGKMADHVDKINAQFKEKLNAEREQMKLEKDELEKKEKKRESQVTKLVSQLKEVSETVTKEREEKVNLQKTIQAEIIKLQKAEEELAIQAKLLEDAKKAVVASTMKEQEALKEANLKFEAEMKGLREARYNSANKVEELTGKLEALTINLNSMAEDIKKKDEALLNAEKQKARLASSETEVSELRQQITKLKLELTKNTQLANRLQSEKDASERNHGQRTALMGMLEGQLAEVNEKNSEANAKLEAALYDLSQKDEVVQSLEDKLKETLGKLAAVEQKNKEVSESLTQAQKATGKKNSMMADSLQKELQQLQQSTARKSAAAQKLIQEREAECASLRAANKVLQHEVDKGSLSDRKIFELAEFQSNRESAQQIEIEVRDNALERLKKALLERDWDLASAENTVHEVEAQVEELGRVKRREDVNMDYLKSIVVQYLSKPPGTSERAALLPVLATLLQFDANDYRLIEEGKKSLTWFGSIEPKVIGGGAAASSTDMFTSAISYLGGSAISTSNGSVATVSSPAPSRAAASAEISLSAPASKPKTGSGRTTSLQF